MLRKINFLLTLFILYISIGNILSVCVPGDNCPYFQGVCKFGKCVCLDGYQTFIQQTSKKPIYCNYEQYSRWLPFVLEFFIPSSGLFYIGRNKHGFIKLFLFIMGLSFGRDTNSLLCIFGIAFCFMYFFDLIGLAFALYYDGNNIALV